LSRLNPPRPFHPKTNFKLLYGGSTLIRRKPNDPVFHTILTFCNVTALKAFLSPSKVAGGVDETFSTDAPLTNRDFIPADCKFFSSTFVSE
jgi:hypothetical protein